MKRNVNRTVRFCFTIFVVWISCYKANELNQIKSLKHTNTSISFLNHKPTCSRNYISHSRKDIGSSHLFLKQTPLDSVSQCSTWHHKWYNSPPHGYCQPVWPSGKALRWLAEGPRFESALALLSLQKLWSADTVLWLCPSQLMKH